MTHVSVLLQEAIDQLAIEDGDVVVDGTAGGGGHIARIAELFPHVRIIGIDQDSDALARVRERVSTFSDRITLVEDNFRNLDGVLKQAHVETFNRLLLDLGMSSDQLEQSGRGFSFMRDEPLQMTFKTHPDSTTTTAYTIVNEWSLESLIDILRGFGEEAYASRIARAIVQAREQAPLKTTSELRALIESVVPRRHGHRGINPATRTFQALRIAVNDELGALREVLEKGMTLCAPHGRIAVITFHSIEDRIVKHMFQDAVREGKGILPVRKPIDPSDEEIKENPRARSAHLRVFQKE